MSTAQEWGKGTQAKLIKDSLNTRTGHRLSTWVLKYPRFVHAELMTHRQFSRNSSSSRAIPVKRLIQNVIDDPAMPCFWGKNQKGMKARQEIDPGSKQIAIESWLRSRDIAVERAQRLNELCLHKQIVNRIIEPWMHIVVIMSTTTLSNWFALRDHKDAQPEIALLARKMREIYESSQPEQVGPLFWHIPFITEEEQDLYTLKELKKISVGRCARVSYLTHDGVRDPKKDMELHDFLLSSKPPHASPFEHIAMAADLEPGENALRHGNFTGWMQYRKLIPNEFVQEEEYVVKSGSAVPVTY